MTALPGVTGRAQCSQRRGTLVHSQNRANVCLPDFCTFKVLGVSAGVPSLAYGGHSKAWDSPLVHPTKEVFPVSHVIRSVDTRGFLSASPAAPRSRGRGGDTSVQGHVLLPSPACHEF